MSIAQRKKYNNQEERIVSVRNEMVRRWWSEHTTRRSECLCVRAVLSSTFALSIYSVRMLTTSGDIWGQL